ncbi:MAG: hypothetical protein ACTSUE_17520 [Promethearchaeota archaeon]
MKESKVKKFYVPAMVALYFLMLLIARLLFPHDELYPYHWTTSTISRIGWAESNPNGVYFFCCAFVWLGASTIVMAFYYQKRFVNLRGIHLKLVTTIMIVVGVAEILLGLIVNRYHPQDLWIKIHGLNATIAFLGTFTTLALFGASFIWNLKKGGSKPFPARSFMSIFTVILTYGIFALVLQVITLSVGAEGRYIQEEGAPLFLSMPFWEWQSHLVSLGLYFFLVYAW